MTTARPEFSISCSLSDLRDWGSRASAVDEFTITNDFGKMCDLMMARSRTSSVPPYLAGLISEIRNREVEPAFLHNGELNKGVPKKYLTYTNGSNLMPSVPQETAYRIFGEGYGNFWEAEYNLTYASAMSVAKNEGRSLEERRFYFGYTILLEGMAKRQADFFASIRRVLTRPENRFPVSPRLLEIRRWIEEYFENSSKLNRVFLEAQRIQRLYQV